MELSPFDKHLELDIRVRDRWLRDGVIDSKAVDKFLNELPDLAEELIQLSPAELMMPDEEAEDDLTFSPAIASETDALS